MTKQSIFQQKNPESHSLTNQFWSPIANVLITLTYESLAASVLKRSTNFPPKTCYQLSVQFVHYLSGKLKFRTFKEIFSDEKQCVHLFIWSPVIFTVSVTLHFFQNLLCFQAVFFLVKQLCRCLSPVFSFA